MESATLKTTPLNALHRELGAKMVGFGGYDMPVQYQTGILKEHLHVRAHAGLFDVSHMGQIRLSGAAAAAALETLVPADIAGLRDGQSRYTMFTTETGGIIDDLMVTRLAPELLMLVVNAGGKAADYAHLQTHLTTGIGIEYLAGQALLALQGPDAVTVLGAVVPQIVAMPFMTGLETPLFGVAAIITRSGYTGEDGFEISISDEDAEHVARELLKHQSVLPIGLGARDSLRLEAGLCLYGHDIDLATTPVEAGLGWSIGKRRRGEGGFKGAETILPQLAHGAPRARVGILAERPRAGSRGHGDPERSGRDDRHRHQRRLFPHLGAADRHGLCALRPSRCGHAGRPVGARPRSGSGACGAAVCSTQVLQGKGLEMAARRFTKDHEWIELAGEIGTVGISLYAQKQLGDVVYVELPVAGRELVQGRDAAVVESVKAASEVYAPVDGTVTEVNEALNDDPAKVNGDPEGEAWFFKLRVSDAVQLDGLMDEDAYKAFVAGLA